MKFLPILALSFLFMLPGISSAQADQKKVYEELAFLKEFAGKDADFIKSTLGEPDSIEKTENTSGTIEFWIYRDLVTQVNSDKRYRFTQIGIVNDAVETLGHTNRIPNK